MSYNNIKQPRLRKNLVAKSVIATLACTPLWLFAEEADLAEEESKIEVLTVTAQKRVQNILKVPVTVGTVSEDTIEESGSIGLSDIDKFIPGFEFSDGNMTQAGVTIRGISSPNISVGGDPSSATFYDDVYMPRAAQNVIFSDMARVEVLKGPQGTLFGRNAAMGVVNMVPKSPFADFEAFAKATVGTDNLQRYEGMVNIPLTDSFYMRANILSNTQDGIVQNVANPEWFNDGQKVWDLGERSHLAGRVSFLWDIADTTDIQLSVDIDDLEQAPPMAVGVSEYAYNQGKTPFASKAENDINMGVESREMYGVTAKFNHEFNNELSMKYVASFRDWQTINRQDEDGTQDITRYFDTSNNEDSNIFYTELQLNYVGDRVNIVTGFSYSKEDVSQRTELNLNADTVARLVTEELNNFAKGGVAAELEAALGGNTDAHAEAAFGPGVTFAGAVDTMYLTTFGGPMDHLWNAGEWANYLNSSGAFPMEVNEDFINATGDLTYEAVSQAFGFPEIYGPSYSGQWWQENVYNTGDFTNWGIYGDIDYAVTDKWNIIGGLRYSKDTKDFTWYIPLTTFADVRPGVSNQLFPEMDLASSDSWDKVTGRAVTSYQVSDDHMVFASYSTGYKSGGYDSLDPNIIDGEVVAFAPESTTNYEIGYKGILWNQVIANVSAYYLELDGQQQSVNSKEPGDVGAVPRIINVDKEMTGIEMDIRWMATDSITFGVVTEVRSIDTFTPEYYNGEGELVAPQKTTSDSNLNYTFTFDWMPDFSVGTTNFHLDYVFLKNTNADNPGLEDYVKAIDEYFLDTKLLNARLSWTNDNDNIEIGLWGKNLLDERYMLSVGGLTADLLGTPHGRINRGLEAGVDFKYMF